MPEESTVPFPRTGAPALRALETAGYTHLHQLDGVPMRSVLALHGMGKQGIGALRRAMAQHGWAFAEDDPRVGAPNPVVSLLVSLLSPLAFARSGTRIRPRPPRSTRPSGLPRYPSRDGVKMAPSC